MFFNFSFYLHVFLSSSHFSFLDSLGDGFWRRVSVSDGSTADTVHKFTEAYGRNSFNLLRQEDVG